MAFLDTYLAKALEAKATADVERPIAQSVANENNMSAFVQLRTVVTDKYTFTQAVNDYKTFINSINQS